jgi:hypothetical protein
MSTDRKTMLLRRGRFYYDFEKREAPFVPRDVSSDVGSRTLTQPASTEPLRHDVEGTEGVNIELDEGGADRSVKALPAAGTVDNSGERSAPDVDLNLNRLTGDRSGPTPDVPRLTEKRTDSLDDGLDGRLTPQPHRGIDDLRPDAASG